MVTFCESILPFSYYLIWVSYSIAKARCSFLCLQLVYKVGSYYSHIIMK